ncbi:unnamed protein product [Allacma fusca]|uniref:Uncharacterized protein n=1 Tax=Allacma fusca TaxID=39272 RepID=A0A8J2KKM4_9HEXA|nr:unnamed protein product [Allacma fusca]
MLETLLTERIRGAQRSTSRNNTAVSGGSLLGAYTGKLVPFCRYIKHKECGSVRPEREGWERNLKVAKAGTQGVYMVKTAVSCLPRGVNNCSDEKESRRSQVRKKDAADGQCNLYKYLYDDDEEKKDVLHPARLLCTYYREPCKWYQREKHQEVKESTLFAYNLSTIRSKHLSLR